MRQIFLFFYTIVVVLSKSIVHHYTDSDFEELTQLKNPENEKINVIVFHASWCPHCKKFLPEFQSVAETIEKQGNPDNMVFGLVEIEENHKLKARFKVDGIPVIYIFKNRRMFEFTQNRNAENLFRFLTDSKKSRESSGNIFLELQKDPRATSMIYLKGFLMGLGAGWFLFAASSKVSEQKKNA
eukprot:snap_masked-scaffold_9-processed-gene-7.45-mRNA-1 protein AED:1.00 eAED:1.00 QI:0/0/0/0/1/1/3/0/183